MCAVFLSPASFSQGMWRTPLSSADVHWVPLDALHLLCGMAFEQFGFFPLWKHSGNIPVSFLSAHSSGVGWWTKLLQVRSVSSPPWRKASGLPVDVWCTMQVPLAVLHILGSPSKLWVGFLLLRNCSWGRSKWLLCGALLMGGKADDVPFTLLVEIWHLSPCFFSSELETADCSDFWLTSLSFP